MSALTCVFLPIIVGGAFISIFSVISLTLFAFNECNTNNKRVSIMYCIIACLIGLCISFGGQNLLIFLSN